MYEDNHICDKHHAKSYSQISMMWIPYIIFKNTDDDEAVKVDAQTEDGTMRTKVSVKRENNFTRSGPEIADEVAV